MTVPRPAIVLLAGESTSAAVLYGLYDVLFSVGAVYLDMTMGAPGSEALDVIQTVKNRCRGAFPGQKDNGGAWDGHGNLLHRIT